MTGESANVTSAKIQGSLLLLMAVAGVMLFLPRVFPVDRPVVHTKLRPGERTRIVVVMPTNLTPEFRDLARAAIDSVRLQVQRAGGMFETVGVSDQWTVAQGLADLGEIGPFDEVIVGRNWLNHGVERYISSFGARPAVPQVVVVDQWIRMDSLPFEYGPIRVVSRVTGNAELIQWSRGGFELSRPDIHD